MRGVSHHPTVYGAQAAEATGSIGREAEPWTGSGDNRLYSSGKNNCGRIWIDDASLLRKDINRELLSNPSFEQK
jgi:hypothetical protein